MKRSICYQTLREVIGYSVYGETVFTIYQTITFLEIVFGIQRKDFDDVKHVILFGLATIFISK